MSDLEKDMVEAMRDLLGDGYTLDYYQSSASEFIDIAESHTSKLEERIAELVKMKNDALDALYRDDAESAYDATEILESNGLGDENE